MKNYYDLLGVAKNATADDIKRAYRKLAAQHHPDKGGDTQVFQEITQAYNALSDPQKRAEYDRPGFGGQGFGGFQNGTAFDFDSIFSIFGTRFHNGPGHQQQQRRQQARMTLWITLSDAISGLNKTISVGTQQGTHAVEVEIPAGIDDGDTVQYGGVGPGGMDLLITYRIHPNPKWQRNGLTLACDHTVNIWDLILGCEIEITDALANKLQFTVPPGTQPSARLRLKGRGIAPKNQPPGDLIVRIQAQLPAEISPELRNLIEQERNK